MKPIEMLMVEDNPGDVVLVREAVAKTGLPYHITVVRDGIEAAEYFHGIGKRAGPARPDLIVLDLKLPRRSGREVLDDILPDPSLNAIPLVVLSSSRSELVLVRPYLLPTQTAIDKPSTFAGYIDLVKAIEAFRLSVAFRGWPGSTEKTP